MMLRKIFRTRSKTTPAPSPRADTALSPAPSTSATPETTNPVPPPLYHIDAFWCDRDGLYIKGWLHWGAIRIKRVALVVGEFQKDVTWHERADLLTHYPEADIRCGYEVYLICQPYVPAIFHVEATDGSVHQMLIFFPRRPIEPGLDSHLYLEFIRRVNEGKLSVLHIGSRLGPGQTHSLSDTFPGASRVIGFDVHPGPGVDIVGDVHTLSDLIEPESVDAIISISVIEHLELPWIAVAEMNRVLKPGGLIFHSMPFCWPPHEMPNDFWRCTDEGLKVLFGPRFGFTVIEAQMTHPAQIYPDHRVPSLLNLPLTNTYAESCVLAYKSGSAMDFGNTGTRAQAYPKG